MAKQNFSSRYSSLYCHTILQQSFYADLVLKKLLGFVCNPRSLKDVTFSISNIDQLNSCAA